MHGAFSQQMQEAIRLSREEAVRMGHDYIGTEHMLLALIGLGDGRASRILRRLCDDTDRIRRGIEETVGTTGSTIIGNIPLTSQAEKALRDAVQEAETIDHIARADTQHLLLALLRDDANNAARMMEGFGITYGAVRAELEMPESHAGAEEEPGIGGLERIMERAREEAIRLGNDYIGKTHLLLGLLEEEDGAKILAALGADAATIRHRVEARVRVEGAEVPTPGFHITRQAERTLRLGRFEARIYRSGTVEPAHLLLALLRDEDDIVTDLLVELHITFTSVRAEIERMTGAGTTGSTGGAAPFSAHLEELLHRSRLAARHLHAGGVAPHHLLIAMTSDDVANGLQVLRRLGADPKIIRTKIEETVGRGSAGFPFLLGKLPFSKGTDEVIVRARREAANMRSMSVGTEHLLLALLAEKDSVAAYVLWQLDITHEMALMEAGKLERSE